MTAEQMQILTDCFRQLTTNATAQAGPTRVRPKAINCKTFVLGDNFSDFCVHFVECIKAAYDFSLPTDKAELEAACLSWLPTKLEPGPTLIAYDSLSATDKATWDAVVSALTDAFADETAKEVFLSDIAAFKRESRTLIEYKNELLRRMNSHQPDLRAVSVEFQRQATTRFIEGLEDDVLKRELRRHCKRDKMNVDAAYHFVVDYEASDLQSRLREGEGEGATASFGAIAVRSQLSPPRAVSIYKEEGETGQLRAEVQRLSARMDRAEQQIQELLVENEKTNERVVSLGTQVQQISASAQKMAQTIEDRFKRLEQIVLSE